MSNVVDGDGTVGDDADDGMVVGMETDGAGDGIIG